VPLQGASTRYLWKVPLVEVTLVKMPLEGTSSGGNYLRKVPLEGTSGGGNSDEDSSGRYLRWR
jgi:hypothetical protein